MGQVKLNELVLPLRVATPRKRLMVAHILHSLLCQLTKEVSSLIVKELPPLLVDDVQVGNDG